MRGWPAKAEQLGAGVARNGDSVGLVAAKHADMRGIMIHHQADMALPGGPATTKDGYGTMSGFNDRLTPIQERTGGQFTSGRQVAGRHDRVDEGGAPGRLIITDTGKSSTLEKPHNGRVMAAARPLTCPKMALRFTQPDRFRQGLAPSFAASGLALKKGKHQGFGVVGEKSPVYPRRGTITWLQHESICGGLPG